MLFSSMAKITAAVLLLSATLIPAAAAEYQEGQDYITVTGIPEATKPVVREFFRTTALIAIIRIRLSKKRRNCLREKSP
ncbi:hypothetical protein [Shewanella dokdonensis]|uniref:hypothetical protein n=1 Tax=Shewanella dokdonensis TaxID=712036 RepID=UPI001FD56492|nr:hypothetical protein [Shewanella dokdonensis]